MSLNWFPVFKNSVEKPVKIYFDLKRTIENSFNRFPVF